MLKYGAGPFLTAVWHGINAFSPSRGPHCWCESTELERYLDRTGPVQLQAKYYQTFVNRRKARKARKASLERQSTVQMEPPACTDLWNFCDYFGYPMRFF